VKTIYTIERTKNGGPSVLKTGDRLTVVVRVGDGPSGARVALLHRGQKMAYCSGGGYDMTGTVFADFLETLPTAQRTLKAAHERGAYGVRQGAGGGRFMCDGACGLSSVEAAFGVRVRYEGKA
jgi:hypothetical protein